MSSRRFHPARSFRVHPLAACLVAALGLGDASAAARPSTNVIVVTSCQDSGSGSLRAAVQASLDGDHIDLTQLPCSQITLTSGRIDVSHNLLLQGPGSGLLTIDGDNTDRIFNQDVNAELAIYGLTLQRGYGFLAGGCIYSNGPIVLNDAVITHCRVIGDAGTSIYQGGGLQVNGELIMISSSVVDNEVYTSLGGAIGGGVSVTGDLAMIGSTISGNSAQTAAPDGVVRSGGAEVGGTLQMQYSTISNNVVGGVAPHQGSDGGARVLGIASITNSTISGNVVDGGIGGLRLYGQGASSASPSVIVNSTISDNQAYSIGGLYARGDITIANSTIALNTESTGTAGGLFVAYGLADLESTIVASNSGHDPEVNIGLGIGGSLTGANDLIGPSGGTTLPPGTIQSDPLLLPLANNGGPTLTHALQAGSPAIDAGNNDQGLSNDQRGAGFARVLGAAADIGAVEFDDDVIFANGFD